MPRLLLVWALALPPLVWVRAREPIGNTALLAMAMIASLPVLGILASWGRYLSNECDEYLSEILTRRDGRS